MSNRNLVHVSSLARNTRVGERSRTFDLGFTPSLIGGNPFSIRYVAPVAVGIEKGTGQDQRIGNNIALRRMVATLTFFWKPTPASAYRYNSNEDWANLYSEFMKLITPCVCRLTIGRSNMTWDTDFDPAVPAWSFRQLSGTFSVPMQISIHSTGYDYSDDTAVRDHIYQDETVYLRDEGYPVSRDVLDWVRESFNTTCIAGPSITDIYDSDAVNFRPIFAQLLQGLYTAQQMSRDIEIVFDPPILVNYDDDGNVTSQYSPVIQFMANYENLGTHYASEAIASICELGICITLEWDDGYFASNLRQRFRGVGEAAAEAFDPDDPDDHDAAAGVASANIPTAKDHAYGQEVAPNVRILKEFGVPRMTGAEIVRLAREEVEAEEARQSSVNVGPAFDDSELANGGRDARRVREEEDTVTFVRLHQGLSNKYRRGDVEDTYESVNKKRK